MDTARKPFEPIGDVPRWTLIYQHLVGLNPGDVIGYPQLAELLGLHPKNDRAVIGDATRRAGQQMERADHRAIAVIPNKGYRILEPQDHPVAAGKRQRGVIRKAKQTLSVVRATDLTNASAEVRDWQQRAEVNASQMVTAIRVLDVRTQRLAAAMATTVVKVDRNEAEVEKLKARLARLENSGA